MKDVLKYKNFLGSVHFSAEDKVFYGKVMGISDLVTFEGKSVSQLINAFHEAVNDYLELCKEAGKEPERPFKGSFNVRIPPDLHNMVVKKATMMGVSLNQLVREALEEKVAVL